MNHQTTSLRLNQPLPCHAVLNSSDRKSRLRLIPSPFSEALKSRDYSLLSPWMERSSPDTRTTPPQLRSGNADGRGNYVAIVPPYWQHHRAGSYASVGDGKPPPIRLEDHTEEPSEQSGALWAKSVTILDYVIVSGSKTGVGAYVVWNCKVETLDVCANIPALLVYFMCLVVIARGRGADRARIGRTHHYSKTACNCYDQE